MKVLIVDDDRVSRMLLGHILTREFGGQIAEALHGAEALEQLRREPFDFILLDLMMPVMDGLQTLEAIRADEGLRGLPVVILSAVKEEGKVRRILQLGVADYLAKPLHPTDIVQRLRRIVPAILSRVAPAANGAGPARGEQADDHAGADAREPRVELVIADADPIFRSFLRGLLGREYRIIEAETGAKALRRCLESRPVMLLLGDGLGAVDRTLLIRKLRAAPEHRELRIVGLVPPKRVDPSHIDSLCDATLVRTFVSAVFREQFNRLANPLAPSGGTGELVAGVRLQLVSTVEQVFGMMLGAEVELQASYPQLPGVCVSAQVDLALLHEDFTLTLLCACPVDVGSRIAGLMRNLSSDWVGNDLAAAALGDIATIMAVRLQRTLTEQGRRVEASVAAVRRGPARFADQALLTLSFNSAAGDLPFNVAVRGDRKTAMPAGAGTLGARS